MNFKERTIVITGAGKGIGAACARAFHEEGANIALLDIDETVADAEKDRWYFQTCNVADEAAVKQAMQAIYEKYGRIDCLINNAGIQRYGTVTTTSSEEWDTVMNVNLKSMFLCAKYALPFMLRTNKGAVINIASAQAFLSQQNVAAYTTAKTAVLGLTRSIAIDYAPGIRCVAVCPGTIDTPMLRDAIALSPDPGEVMQECIDMHLVKRIGTPEEVAALIKFLCSDHAAFITGQYYRIDGGLGITIAGSKKEN